MTWDLSGIHTTPARGAAWSGEVLGSVGGRWQAAPVAINLRLHAWTEAEPDDAWGRTHVGWRPDLTDEELWAVNRGVWSLGTAAEQERFATLSYRKTVRVVVELAGPREVIYWHGRTWHALAGRVLAAGHPAYDALIGRDVGQGRNPGYFDTSELDTLPVTSPTPPATDETGGAGVGQGWQLDAAVRKAIEDAAQERLEAYWRADGWTVTDVRHAKRGYDAYATKDGAERYLEAKGTMTDGASVIVTAAEVVFARNHQGQGFMGIWSGMALNADGTVDPAAGDFRVIPWNPDAGALRPREYDWTPPTDT